MHIDRERLRKLNQEELQEETVAEEGVFEAEPEIKAEDSLEDLVTFSKHDSTEEADGKPDLTEDVRHVTEELPAKETVPEEEVEEKSTDEEEADLPVSSPVKRLFSDEETEEEEVPRKKLSGKWILLIVALVLILAASLFKVYMDQSYKPLNSDKTLDTSELDIDITDNMIVVRNSNKANEPAKGGLVFYSDLRVEGECYLPLMIKLSNMGYDCFLPIAFGNQPYLNTEGAISVIRKYPSIKNWFLVGHSNSCTPAATFAEDNASKLR